MLFIVRHSKELKQRTINCNCIAHINAAFFMRIICVYWTKTEIHVKQFYTHMQKWKSKLYAKQK